MSSRHGERGERGPQGDHGQDGAPGKDGVLPLDYYEDPAVNQALAVALGEKKMRMLDKRLLIMYAFLVVGMIVMYSALDHQARQQRQTEEKFQMGISKVCTDLDESHVRINSILDSLSNTALSSPVRTEAERQEIAKTYESLHLARLNCPPVKVR